LKIDIQTYKEKILSGEPKIRAAALNELCRYGTAPQLESLMALLLKNRVGNTVSLAIKAIGTSGNAEGVNALIEAYGTAKINEQKLIIESLLKLGVFRNFFEGNALHPNIMQQLWPLLQGCRIDQLKKIMSLTPEEFRKQIDFAWHSTKHWRK